jgi:hypothetical protein
MLIASSWLGTFQAIVYLIQVRVQDFIKLAGIKVLLIFIVIALIVLLCELRRRKPAG